MPICDDPNCSCHDQDDDDRYEEGRSDFALCISSPLLQIEGTVEEMRAMSIQVAKFRTTWAEQLTTMADEITKAIADINDTR